jgi:hypothetical protein
MKHYLWSELSLIFIPEGETKTLAGMDYQEYLAWYKVASEKSGPEREFSNWLMLRDK